MPFVREFHPRNVRPRLAQTKNGLRACSSLISPQPVMTLMTYSFGEDSKQTVTVHRMRGIRGHSGQIVVHQNCGCLKQKNKLLSTM